MALLIVPAFALGVALRFGLHSHPESKGIYIVEYLFVVLSVGSLLCHYQVTLDPYSPQPCAFIAADYVLLSRLSRYIDCTEYLLVRPSRITRIFISSDVTTFLIQVLHSSPFVPLEQLIHVSSFS
jgi:hypothetical protein